MSKRESVGSLSLSPSLMDIRESIRPAFYFMSDPTIGYFTALPPPHFMCYRYPPGTYRISFTLSTRKLEDDPPNGWGVSSACERAPTRPQPHFSLIIDNKLCDGTSGRLCRDR